jgi:hypothetical protein
MHDKKSQSDAHLPTQTEMLLPQHGRPLSHAQLAQLWDIVVRAHYLALELGDSCAKSGLESARLALSLSEFLSGWATTFGLELERAEKTALSEENRLAADGEGG